MRTAVKVALVVAVLLGNSVVASAADFCFESAPLVLKNFSLPLKGTCKAYFGFYPEDGFGNPAFFVNGSACGSSDNNHITFTGTVVAADGASVQQELIVLNRATLSGTHHMCQLSAAAGGCISAGSIAKSPCSPAKPPVP